MRLTVSNYSPWFLDFTWQPIHPWVAEEQPCIAIVADFWIKGWIKSICRLDCSRCQGGRDYQKKSTKFGFSLIFSDEYCIYWLNYIQHEYMYKTRQQSALDQSMLVNAKGIMAATVVSSTARLRSRTKCSVARRQGIAANCCSSIKKDCVIVGSAMYLPPFWNDISQPVYDNAKGEWSDSCCDWLCQARRVCVQRVWLILSGVVNWARSRWDYERVQVRQQCKVEWNDDCCDLLRLARVHVCMLGDMSCDVDKRVESQSHNKVKWN